MLTALEVQNAQGVSLTFPLDDISDGYSIEDIQGLDPVKATLVSSSFATMDSEQYQSSRREKRNIILKLGLEPDFVETTARGLRSRLYGLFMPKSEVTMNFIDDEDAPLQIVGRIESFDSPPFAKDPDATISIICFDSDFYDPISVEVEGTSVTDSSEQIINYDGTIETGFVFRYSVDRTVGEFSVTSRSLDGILRRMDFVGTLNAGDVLEISTIPGAKHVTATNAQGQSRSMLYGLSPYSSWIELFPGSNNFRVYTSGAVIPYTIEYTKKYGGL